MPPKFSHSPSGSVRRRVLPGSFKNGWQVPRSSEGRPRSQERLLRPLGCNPGGHCGHFLSRSRTSVSSDFGCPTRSPKGSLQKGFYNQKMHRTRLREVEPVSFACTAISDRICDRRSLTRLKFAFRSETCGETNPVAIGRNWNILVRFSESFESVVDSFSTQLSTRCG